ncbi:MAG TPA: reactive intermediate/imine deaminase [Cellvibrionales bacterium]|nr:reactive intermediate/imine deaminase [Cellvibrionales bacterium]
MNEKKVISTTAAPTAIGPYSQAVQVGEMLYISGQIPLVPDTMAVCGDDIEQQAQQAFTNLAAIAKAAGANLNDSVKINISVTDLSMFDTVNQVMASFLEPPFPARACVEVAALPKGVKIEIEAVVWVKP